MINDKVTPSGIEKLEQLLAAATPVEWSIADDYPSDDHTSIVSNFLAGKHHVVGEDVVLTLSKESCFSADDLRLIVALRNTAEEFVELYRATQRYWEGYTTNCVSFDGSYDDRLEEALESINAKLKEVLG